MDSRFTQSGLFLDPWRRSRKRCSFRMLREEPWRIMTMMSVKNSRMCAWSFRSLICFVSFLTCELAVFAFVALCAYTFLWYYFSPLWRFIKEILHVSLWIKHGVESLWVSRCVFRYLGTLGYMESRSRMNDMASTYWQMTQFFPHIPMRSRQFTARNYFHRLSGFHFSLRYSCLSRTPWKVQFPSPNEMTPTKAFDKPVIKPEHNKFLNNWKRNKPIVPWCKARGSAWNLWSVSNTIVRPTDILWP